MSRVLVLDGHDETREATLAVLRAAGLDARGVGEEEEALAALEAAAIAVVILDLPVDESLEAARAIREARGPAPAILALLERIAGDGRAEARQAGVDFVVLRPCPAAQLVHHVRRFLPSPVGRERVRRT